jgi:hypothetical protein
MRIGNLWRLGRQRDRKDERHGDADNLANHLSSLRSASTPRCAEVLHYDAGHGLASVL